MQKKLIKIIFFLVVIIICLLWESINSEHEFRVSFLDVGQGDASLIQTSDGKNILIDGGPDNRVISELSQRLSFWDRRIDLMILTHPHADHVTGLNKVLERYEVGRVLYSGVAHNSPTYLAWLNLIKERGITITIIDSPQTIELAKECYLEIIYPDKNLLHVNVDNLNNTSLVMKLEYGDTKFLFTGDIEEEIENYLVEKGIDLSADILKVAHHGSDTSSNLNFLKAVNPSIGVIQVGLNNKFNHPSIRVLNRFKRANVKIYRTDIDGSVSFVVEGNKLKID